MSDQVDQPSSPWVGTLGMLQLFGDAARQGTEEQRERIKGECLPILRDRRMPYAEAVAVAMERLGEIMGPEWRLQPETARFLDSLLGDGSSTSAKRAES